MRKDRYLARWLPPLDNEPEPARTSHPETWTEAVQNCFAWWDADTITFLLHGQSV